MLHTERQRKAADAGFCSGEDSFSQQSLARMTRNQRERFVGLPVILTLMIDTSGEPIASSWVDSSAKPRQHVDKQAVGLHGQMNSMRMVKT